MRPCKGGVGAAPHRAPPPPRKRPQRGAGRALSATLRAGWGQGRAGAGACGRGDYAPDLTFAPISNLPGREGGDRGAGLTVQGGGVPSLVAPTGTPAQGGCPTLVHRPRSSISMSTLQPNLPKTRWHRPCYSHPIPAQQSPWDGVPGGWLPSSPLQVGPSRPWQPCWLPSTLPPAPPPPPGTSRKPQPQPAGRPITVTQPHPACTHHRLGEGAPSPAALTPAAPQAQSKEGAHPRRTQRQPHGTRVTPHSRRLCRQCSAPQDAPAAIMCMGTHAPGVPPAHHAAPRLVCTSNTDVAGESHSRWGGRRGWHERSELNTHGPGKGCLCCCHSCPAWGHVATWPGHCWPQVLLGCRDTSLPWQSHPTGWHPPTPQRSSFHSSFVLSRQHHFWSKLSIQHRHPVLSPLVRH